ncbi:MAG: tail fiber domain-containing protein [Betaproteobacteria bacterium]
MRIWSSLVIAALALFAPALAHRRRPTPVTWHARRQKAPAPDPNIGIAQREQTELARRQQEFFESNFAPRYMQQMDDQLALGRRQVESMEELQDFEMGRSRRFDERYWDTQVPLEDQLIDRAKKFNEAGEQERMAGQAGADVSQSFDISRQNTGRSLSRRGISMSSGAGLAAVMDNSTEEALARAGAVNMTREAARQMGWTRLGEAAALGRGLPGFGAQSSQLAMGAGQGAVGAGQSGMGAISAAQGGFQSNNSSLSNMWQNVGNLGVQRTRLGIDAANSNNSLFDGIAGMAAGGAMRWALSDKRAKTDIKKVGKLDNGLPVYTYRYKGDGRPQLGLMAQDVKKKVPEAVRKADDGLYRVNYALAAKGATK